MIFIEIVISFVVNFFSGILSTDFGVEQITFKDIIKSILATGWVLAISSFYYSDRRMFWIGIVTIILVIAYRKKYISIFIT
jgi:hypothetical protein